jgi:hypothetical protein
MRSSTHARKIKISGANGVVLDFGLPIANLISQIWSSKTLLDYFIAAVDYMADVEADPPILAMLSALILFEAKNGFIAKKSVSVTFCATFQKLIHRISNTQKQPLAQLLQQNGSAPSALTMLSRASHPTWISYHSLHGGQSYSHHVTVGQSCRTLASFPKELQASQRSKQVGTVLLPWY